MTGGQVPLRLALALLALILVVGAGLRFHGLGRESLWNDELQSQWISDLPTPGDVVRTALAEDGHPPLHDVILHVVQKDLGNSEALLRLPSAAAGVLAILALFFSARSSTARPRRCWPPLSWPSSGVPSTTARKRGPTASSCWPCSSPATAGSPFSAA